MALLGTVGFLSPWPYVELSEEGLPAGWIGGTLVEMGFHEGIGWGQLGILTESRKPLLQEFWPPGLWYLAGALCWVDERLLPSLSDSLWGWVFGFRGTSIAVPSRCICQLSLTLVYSRDGAWTPWTSATFRKQSPEGASGCSVGPWGLWMRLEPPRQGRSCQARQHAPSWVINGRPQLELTRKSLLWELGDCFSARKCRRRCKGLQGQVSVAMKSRMEIPLTLPVETQHSQRWTQIRDWTQLSLE